MNLTRQPASTMNRRHYPQPPFPIPNIRPDRMNRRILAQLPPNQQIAIDRLWHHNLMNYLDPLLLPTLANSIAVLDVMPFTRTSLRHPAIMSTLGSISTQQSTADTLLRGFRSGHLLNFRRHFLEETQYPHRPARSETST
jgi:hypothetical protein